MARQVRVAGAPSGPEPSPRSRTSVAWTGGTWSSSVGLRPGEQLGDPVRVPLHPVLGNRDREDGRRGIETQIRRRVCTPVESISKVSLGWLRGPESVRAAHPSDRIQGIFAARRPGRPARLGEADSVEASPRGNPDRPILRSTHPDEAVVVSPRVAEGGGAGRRLGQGGAKMACWVRPRHGPYPRSERRDNAISILTIPMKISTFRPWPTAS